MAKQVETTYGNALFELSLEEGKLDLFYEEALALVDILKENNELLKLLNHPQIDKDEKKAVLENTFNDRISNEILGLMVMATLKGHGAKLVGILEYFVKQVKKEKNIGVASVTSAIELNDAQKKDIENRLIETTSYSTMEIDYQVDASIIGGLIIRIEDRVVDSSIKTKLTTMSQAIMK